MNESDTECQRKKSDTDILVGKSRIIVEQSNAVEAGAELSVTNSSSLPSIVSLSAQPDVVVPCTYVSTLDSNNEITDEDIENFLGDKSYSNNYVPECCHLAQVKPVPPTSIDIKTPCIECGSEQDNWICLTCYKVYCSRYVNEHMLKHTESTMHPIVLSFSDISVWCYGCDDFVEHDVICEAKNIVLNAKYGSLNEGITLSKST